MATTQPAEDRPVTSKTSLVPNGDASIEPLNSVRLMPIDMGQPADPAATPSRFDRRRSGATMWTYRQLVSRGLAPAEAANLTAYLNRLPIGEQPWTLTELNTLLFLRSLHRSDRLGPPTVDRDR